MRTTVRSEERIRFLSDILVGAIESGDVGSWMAVHEYSHPEGRESEWFAIISEDDDEQADAQRHRVTLDTIAHGLSVIRSAEMRTTPVVEKTLNIAGEPPHTYTTGGETVLHNAQTGARLYLSESNRKRIMRCDRANDDVEDLDAIDYLAILEIALFGSVVYA